MQDAGVEPSEVVVCMIFDGIEKMHHSMVDYLQHELLLLDPAVLKTKHMGLSVTMQLFERTVEMRQVRSRRQYSPPMQMIAAIKMRNGGKLNSHAWIMQAFCRQLNPKYLVLIDVGTIPKRKALLHLYRCMEEDPNVGGCCGEIVARNASPFSILEASQNFEYKVAHVMDKVRQEQARMKATLPRAESTLFSLAGNGVVLWIYFSTSGRLFRIPMGGNTWHALEVVLHGRRTLPQRSRAVHGQSITGRRQDTLLGSGDATNPSLDPALGSRSCCVHRRSRHAARADATTSPLAERLVFQHSVCFTALAQNFALKTPVVAQNDARLAVRLRFDDNNHFLVCGCIAVSLFPGDL